MKGVFMSEYEIFNNTDEPPVKKQKPVKGKEKKVKQSCDCTFLKDAFSFSII